MKNENLGLQDTESLQKKQKLLKMVTAMLGGMLMVLLVLAIYISFKKGFSALVVVPIALMPILMLNVISIKNIQKELTSREK
ncbi:MAG: redox-active disulfide protein 2 [Pedobacter sp.]|nr:MAG: redox-active disulfide protein 2 [Pedobacter sp.]